MTFCLLPRVESTLKRINLLPSANSFLYERIQICMGGNSEGGSVTFPASVPTHINNAQ